MTRIMQIACTLKTLELVKTAPGRGDRGPIEILTVPYENGGDYSHRVPEMVFR